jgi:hypothetical protein
VNAKGKGFMLGVAVGVAITYAYYNTQASRP